MNLNEMWSNILVYKPIYDLSYNKKQNDDYNDDNDYNDISKCIQNYLDNSPYKILQSLNNSINTVNVTLDNLKNKIQDFNSDFIDKIEDKEYINKIISSNSGIDGNSIYEVYYMMYKESKSLETFKQNYIINNFGIDVKEEEIENICNDINNKIIENEINNNLKNNYINLAFDSYCNVIIDNYLNDIENDNNNIIMQILFKQNQNIITDNSDTVKDLIKTEFDNNKTNAQNEYNKCLNYISSDNINKAYNQCCNLRKKMNDSIDITNAKDFSKSSQVAINCLNNIKTNTIKNAFSSINELIKSIMLSKILKNNYTKKLIINENYKNIFNI